MKPLRFCLAVFLPLAATGLAQSAPAKSPALDPKVSAVFQKYCVECHGATKPKGNVSLERLLAQPAVGPHADEWDKVVAMLESRDMPPDDAEHFPTDTERTAASAWLRAALKSYEREHAGEPGRITVRRLTSGEYAYAIRDLTGIDIASGVDASSDSAGGEGFTNFGDVQFVQDASIERYLEAAKKVADHAVIGAGPLEFYADAGRTGLELSALSRINELYAAKGFRVVSGEGGRPFGLDRYGKAFFVAWYFKHRAALGDPKVTLRDLAAKEGITGRFAEHIWSVVNQPKVGFPVSETVDRWKALPTPTADRAASVAQGRAGCDEIYQRLTRWPSWFFGRGDLAAGGAGDESPLVFDDTSLKVAPSHQYSLVLGGGGFGAFRGGAGGVGGVGAGAGRARGGPAPTPGAPIKVHLQFANLNPSPDVKSVAIWRNPRLITRGPIAGGLGGRGGRGANPAADPAVNATANPTVVPAGNPIENAVVGAAGAAGARGRGRGPTGPVLSEQPLRAVLPADIVAALGFGQNVDGSKMAPEDLATTGPVTIELPAPAPETSVEFLVDVELGADRNGVARVVVTDRLDGPPARGALARVFLGDQDSAGYRTFRAGIAEYVSLLPPNSHGEANPADKDPVPPPFDNTYNSPEHDAFVLKVKYQRNDRFFTDNLVDGADRLRLNQAWNDLFGSWPYHDAYLGMLDEHFGLKLKSRRIADMTPAQIATLPAEARPHVVALRAHHDEVVNAEKLAEPGQIEDTLAFASRAWRRPLTVAEKTRLKDFYRHARSASALDHDDAIRAVLARILVSPAFLYRVETVASRAEQPLNDWEMASRLSFFLWSSVPDDELRRAAAARELTKPALLAKQVKRMTADPKARRLATEFFGQWLGFYRFDEYREVDTGRFPEFTDDVKLAMYDEAVSTFEYLVRRDRPIREIVAADYTFLNQTLAKFYGIDRAVKSKDAVELVEGANAFNRGGVLRSGVMLTTTSAPLRTSPVKRGDWILRRILGTPTPPPPADAGTIPRDDKAFNGQTLREQLAAHKRNAACAACHLKIDPLGFPLEGFDPVGRMRDNYFDGKPVDVTGEFADKTVISGADGLLKYLQTQDKQLTRTLARKMLGYALGRTVQASDRPLLNEMAAAGGDATFSDLALKIVTSRQFRNRQGLDADSLAAATPSSP